MASSRGISEGRRRLLRCAMPFNFIDLRDEYRRLFRTARVRPAHKPLVEQTVHALVAHKDRYEAVGDPIDIPWWFVAVVHQMEASRNFHTHLHNGDPLTARTVHVPRNRPLGNPPFTFEESARDALKLEGFAHVPDWSISHALFRFERFNGFGYRKPSIAIASPYLWSFCQHYTVGKFASDGIFDPDLVSRQIGAGVLLRVMVDEGHVTPASSTAAVA
jgi:lysozyme family protein